MRGKTHLESQVIPIKDSGKVLKHFAADPFIDGSDGTPLPAKGFFIFQHQGTFPHSNAVTTSECVEAQEKLTLPADV